MTRRYVAGQDKTMILLHKSLLNSDWTAMMAACVFQKPKA